MARFSFWKSATPKMNTCGNKNTLCHQQSTQGRKPTISEYTKENMVANKEIRKPIARKYLSIKFKNVFFFGPKKNTSNMATENTCRAIAPSPALNHRQIPRSDMFLFSYQYILLSVIDHPEWNIPHTADT